MTTKITQNMIADGAVGDNQLEKPLTRGTAQATTSGTAFDFNDIPSWVKKIFVIFNGVDLSASGDVLVQLGDSGGLATSGYVSRGTDTADSSISSTAGMIVRLAGTAATGVLELLNISGNTWVAAGTTNNGGRNVVNNGVVTLTGTLDRLRITRTSTDTFTAGSVNIMYE